jgi:hypothetical protein
LLVFSASWVSHMVPGLKTQDQLEVYMKYLWLWIKAAFLSQPLKFYPLKPKPLNLSKHSTVSFLL